MCYTKVTVLRWSFYGYRILLYVKPEMGRSTLKDPMAYGFSAKGSNASFSMMINLLGLMHVLVLSRVFIPSSKG